MLFAFVAYKEQFAQRVSALIDKGVELKMLRLQGERLADIVLAAPEQVHARALPRSAADDARAAAHRAARRALSLRRQRARGAAAA